ncbi:protein kinase-like domain-containing protein [Xylariomycetidae sp. FL2044]|nr:protein kinase-like domain-containing protein [Xylariomycetidae sp. FL2044]
MPRQSLHGPAQGSQVPYIPLSFEYKNCEPSARQLILALRPDWSSPDSHIEFVRFTDGITNTLMKAVNKKDGLSDDGVDREAVLLRAYGRGTDVLIDRHRETQNHEALMRHRLAPELLARFHNGMLYRYLPGRPCQPADLRTRPIYLAVASRLAQWHALMPCIHEKTPATNGLAGVPNELYETAADHAAPGKPHPNVWTVMQKWILALPTDTEPQRTRQADLHNQLVRLIDDLSQRSGLGENDLVFAHCDLLSGNVIIEPKGPGTTTTNGASDEQRSVSFIDYEYATPSPAAFDLANHFAEWGGFDCDYSVLPTRAQRLEFIREYIHVYFGLLAQQGKCGEAVDEVAEVQKLMVEVDVFRGVPGFYWGIWALIQATISQIDFDYAAYAEVRLGEYWGWREESSGIRDKLGKEMTPREKRWAQAE